MKKFDKFEKTYRQIISENIFLSNSEINDLKKQDLEILSWDQGSKLSKC